SRTDTRGVGRATRGPGTGTRRSAGFRGGWYVSPWRPQDFRSLFADAKFARNSCVCIQGKTKQSKCRKYETSHGPHSVISSPSQKMVECDRLCCKGCQQPKSGP